MTPATVRRCLSAACLGVLLVGSSRSAAAQEQAFAEALRDLTAAIEGTYGSEGARIAPALDRMTAALAAWDRDIQAAATGVAPPRANEPVEAVVARHLTLARMYNARGRPLEALRFIAEAARANSANADVHLLRAFVLDASLRSDEALAALHTAWALDRRDPVKAYYVAGRSTDPDETNRALAALIEAYQSSLIDGVRRKPARFPEARIAAIGGGQAAVLPPARYARAYSLVRGREYDAALAEFRMASSRDPLVDDAAARTPALTGAVTALLDGQVRQARTRLEQSPLLAQSSEMHRVLGLTYWIESEFDKSIEQLSAAIRLRSDDERSRIALSRVLTSAGRDEEAEGVLHDALAALPESSLAHWWLGLAYQRDNRFVEARQEFERAAMHAVTGEGALYAAVGRLAMQAGDAAAANEAFARSIAAAPNDADVREQFARTLLLQDRTDAALAEFIAAALAK